MTGRIKVFFHVACTGAHTLGTPFNAKCEIRSRLFNHEPRKGISEIEGKAAKGSGEEARAATEFQ